MKQVICVIIGNLKNIMVKTAQMCLQILHMNSRHTVTKRWRQEAKCSRLLAVCRASMCPLFWVTQKNIICLFFFLSFSLRYFSKVSTWSPWGSGFFHSFSAVLSASSALWLLVNHHCWTYQPNSNAMAFSILLHLSFLPTAEIYSFPNMLIFSQTLRKLSMSFFPNPFLNSFIYGTKGSKKGP